MLNQTNTNKDNHATKTGFTPDPSKQKSYKKTKLHNLNTVHPTYLESEQYLPPESLVFIQFLNNDKQPERHQEGYLPARVDWCYQKQDYYETAIMFIDITCDQCNKKLVWDEIYRTENDNTLCRHCYYKVQSLQGSSLKRGIEKQLLGNVL